MKIKKTDIKELIEFLGFELQDGEKNIYYKNYPKHKDYVIKIDFENEKIIYGSKIKLGDLTTSNFEHSENFVVLECVDRVLEKGYAPENLSLEHKWPMGRKEKGKLDILIFDKENKAYLMIECKTWGSEYEKEKKKMQRDGGQLFSYFQQDTAAKYLCLYASRFLEGKTEFCNEIVKVDEQWSGLNNQKEVFDHWNKNFKDNGIFEEWTNSYDIEIKAITRNRLKELTEEDSGRIFNQFAEILRHNIVSDKPNAFNKIFNLFLCKIVDEDRKDIEELDFQWKDDDTDESLQNRLNDLYRKGMKDYLTKEVTDYNQSQVSDKLIRLDQADREQILKMFSDLRLRKNPEFAFKEVFDEKSFKENAVVVKEVVELLQPFQIRYGHKQQFLGDFFELLLSTGIKQESGQFFTPVPIAKFIISSLPIREFVNRNIDNDNTQILPYIIDYAAGSGHFLTETMDEVQNIIESIDEKKQKPSIKRNVSSWKINPFDWAFDYVYGIEADYRLVKTAKVSCFLNGDGLANVIHADGLDHFTKSVDYKGMLKKASKDDAKNNDQFDILVANPPYSVSAFKNTLKHGKESFNLYDRLTDDSSEIECLFIERAKQLLKPGGVAGIVLPATILNNPGIYKDAREILFKYFNIKAITKFNTNTFMATGTPTITLFLERIENTFWKKVDAGIETFFKNKKDITVNSINNAFSEYVENVFDGITLSDYISFIKKSPNENFVKQEIYQDYKSWFNDLTEIKKIRNTNEKELSTLKKKIQKEIEKDLTKNKKTLASSEISKLVEKDYSIQSEKLEKTHQSDLTKLFYNKTLVLEKERMTFFFLAFPQEIVLVNVGEKKQEKDFIGYEFSNRRGHEGIKMYRDKKGQLTTRLYDENELSKDKVNYYINKKFNNEEVKITDDLKDNVSHVDLISLMKFNQFDVTTSINLSPVVNPFKDSNHELVRCKDIFSLEYGKPLSENMREEGDYPVMGSNGITGSHNTFLLKGPSIIVGRKGSAGKVTYIEENCFPIDTTFYVFNKSDYPLKYIYYLLLVLPLKALSKSMGVPGLNRNDAHLLKVPKIDEKIVIKEIKRLDKIYEERSKTYDSKKKASENEEIFMKKFELEIIKSFV